MHSNLIHGHMNGWLFSQSGSKFYNHVFARAAGPLYRRVAEDIGALAPIGALLDVGAGTGQLACEAARRGLAREIVGVDEAAAMVARSSENARRQGVAQRARFDVGDVRQLPYSDGSFDLIVSTLSLHHWPEVEQPLRELYRVLRPGGRAWIYDVAAIGSETVLAPARQTFLGHNISYERISVGLLLPPFIRFTLVR